MVEACRAESWRKTSDQVIVLTVIVFEECIVCLIGKRRRIRVGLAGDFAEIVARAMEDPCHSPASVIATREYRVSQSNEPPHQLERLNRVIL